MTRRLSFIAAVLGVAGAVGLAGCELPVAAGGASLEPWRKNLSHACAAGGRAGTLARAARAQANRNAAT
jgi:hypothetical protein